MKSLTDFVELAAGGLVGSDERLLHEHLNDLHRSQQPE